MKNSAEKSIQNIYADASGLSIKLLDTRFGPMEYAHYGSGKPVLVIHGNGGGFDQGVGLARGYISDGFQVIAPSRFGYLGSPVPSGASVADQCEVYARLLDSMGIQQTVIFATSAGVTSAIQFALRYPQRVSKLILLSPNAPGEVDLKLPPKSVFKMVMHNNTFYRALITLFRPVMHSLVGVPKGFKLTPGFKAEVKVALAGVMPVNLRTDGIIFDTYVSNPEINRYPLGEVKAPTLVISAVDDPMALYKNALTLAKQIPNARMLAIPDGGHLLLGHAGEARQQICQFLNENLAM